MIVNGSFSTPGPFKQFSESLPATTGIKCQVVVKELYDNEENTWPDRFLFAPKIGDIIQSDDGRRLTVLDVVHTVSEGAPMVIVEIGVDKNNVTPTEGGVVSDGYM